MEEPPEGTTCPARVGWDIPLRGIVEEGFRMPREKLANIPDTEKDIPESIVPGVAESTDPDSPTEEAGVRTPPEN